MVRGDRACAGAIGIARILTEVKGALPVGTGFTLTARADRIDVTDDGSVVIYDYKTGKLPVQKHVEDLYAPQLSLEAAIAEAGGFEDLEQGGRQRARLYPRLGP